MYRAVQESKEQDGGYTRVVHWLEGIAVAALVLVGVAYLFGLLLY
jgi:hypothetical protein